MGWFVTIFIGVFVLAIVGAILNAQDNSTKRNGLAAGRDDAEVFVGDDGSYIMLDFERHTIGLGSRTAIGEATFGDIMTVEVVENGTVLTQTNRGSQAVGAAVGALAFGGIGFLAGGLSGSTHSQSNIGSIVLRIHLASRKLPSQDVQILGSSGKKGHDRNGILAKAGIEKANRLHSLVLQAMRLAAEGAVPKLSGPPVIAAPIQNAVQEPSTPAIRTEPQLAVDVVAPVDASAMSEVELRRRIDALKTRTSNPV